MLISVKPNDIVTIKLVSGEEVLAKLSNITSTTYEVSKPFTLVNSGTQAGVVIMPYIMSAEENSIIPINMTVVAAITKAASTFISEYTRLTSKIQMVTNPDLVTAASSSKLITDL